MTDYGSLVLAYASLLLSRLHVHVNLLSIYRSHAVFVLFFAYLVPVVADVGSFHARIGFGGEDQPSMMARNVCACAYCILARCSRSFRPLVCGGQW